jgi:hypothetical protein
MLSNIQTRRIPMNPVYPLIAGAALLLSACGDKTPPSAEPPKPSVSEAPEAPKATAPGPAFAVPATFRTQVKKAHEGVLAIERALGKDDLGKAKAAFESMHIILHTMPKDGLDSAASAAWDSSDARLMDILHPMASAKDAREMKGYLPELLRVMDDVSGKFR